MIRQPSRTLAPGAVTAETDVELFVKSGTPFTSEGVLYFPGDGIGTARHDRRSGVGSVAVTLDCGKMGICVELTPEGARMMAAKMIESAEEIEAAVAGQAAAAIDAARSRGGCQ